MKPRVRRWIAQLLLAASAFAQASVSLADCPMERGALVQMMVQAAEPPCELGTHVKNEAPRYENRCLAHCTSDLQIAVVPVAIVRAPADTPVLLLPRIERAPLQHSGLDSPPPGTPPPRILQHAFLI